MSLYSCIDLIDEVLKEISPNTPGGAWVDFLQDLRVRLNTMAERSDYESCSQIRMDIHEFLNKEDPTRSIQITDLLNDISMDLKEIIHQIGNKEQKHQEEKALTTFINSLLGSLESLAQFFPKKLTIDEEAIVIGAPNKELSQLHQDLLHSRFVKKRFSQGKDLPIGLSKGECYGLVKSMADSEISIYKKDNPDNNIVFNRVVYEYQRSQLKRADDTKSVKRIRLTREHFCPSLQEQAEALYRQAEINKGNDLYVTLRGAQGLHATYLSLQNDGKIRYMEPNHGAFLFDSKEQFVAAYRTMYMATSNPYSFYCVSLLKEDKQNVLPEDFSFMGKIRSLLTGTKYEQLRGNIYARLGNGMLGASLGGVIGGVIGSFVFPIVGTIIGACVGGFLGGFSGFMAVQKAESHQHFGLLGPYHWLRSSLMGIFFDAKKELSDLPCLRRDLDLLQDPVDEPLNSTSLALDKLGGPGDRDNLMTPELQNVGKKLFQPTTVDQNVIDSDMVPSLTRKK